MCHKSTQTNETTTDYWQRIKGVKSIEFYQNDVRINYMILPVRNATGRKEDDKIKMFTQKSMKRLAFVASNTDVVFTHMTTLTYPKEFESDGKIVKKHLNVFLTWLRQRNEGVNYLWFLEFQERGAPHYHVLTDCHLDKRAVSQRWYDIVGSGDKKHLRAGTRTERLRSERGGANYAVKYARKMRQKVVPAEYENVGRFWGHSTAVKPKPVVVAKMENVTKEVLVGMFEFWEYQPVLQRFPLGTLYNVAGHFPQIMKEFIENEETEAE